MTPPLQDYIVHIIIPPPTGLKQIVFKIYLDNQYFMIASLIYTGTYAYTYACVYICYVCICAYTCVYGEAIIKY